MLTMGGGANPSGLRFRMLGFPVTVAPAFFVVAALIGFTGAFDLGLLLTWVGVIGVSILVHELGHAVAARGVGARPSIVIHGLGGYTTYVPPRPLTRAEQVRISLAGPFAGALLGLAVLLFWRFAAPDATELTRAILLFGVWANLGWGLVNLLPVLPLDGGLVLEAVLPGDVERRRRRALAVTIPVAGAIAVAFLFIGLPFAGVLFGFFGYNAWIELRERRKYAPGQTERLAELLRAAPTGDLAAIAELEHVTPTLPPGEVQDLAKTAVVEAWARAGLPDRARRQLQALPGRADRALYAYVDAHDGDPRAAVPVLEELLAQDPSPTAARYLLLAEVLAGGAMHVPERFLGLPPQAREAGMLRDAQHLAHLRGHFAASARIGQFLVDSLGSRRPADAYNVACSLARYGRPEDAVAWLDRAVEMGWTDTDAFARDPDIAAVWRDRAR